MSMVTYDYSAVEAGGAKRRGQITAGGEQEALRKLTAMGLTPLNIKVRGERKAVFSFQKTTIADIAGLTRELSALVDARIPLDRGLMSIAEHEPKPEMAAMLRDIAARLAAGSPMTRALEDYKHIFGEVYIETVRAAEKSGNLVSVMAHLADLLEKQLEMRQQMKRAMMYPIIVMCVVALAVTVIVVFVVPKFAATFAAQEVKMPIMTRIIQALGESAKAYWWAYLTGIASLIGAITTTWANRSGRLMMERAFLAVPYISKVLIATTCSTFSHVLGIGLGSGLDVIESLEISSRSTGRPVFVLECTAMAERLRGGEELADVIKGTKYLPNFAKRMIASGKDATELSKACGIVARHYDRESSHLLKNINTIIEPIMTVIMAAIVLVVALSVFLPMWQMVRMHK